MAFDDVPIAQCGSGLGPKSPTFVIILCKRSHDKRTFKAMKIGIITIQKYNNFNGKRFDLTDADASFA